MQSRGHDDAQKVTRLVGDLDQQALGVGDPDSLTTIVAADDQHAPVGVGKGADPAHWRLRWLYWRPWGGACLIGASMIRAPRWFHFPVAASALGGLLGAGLLDAALVALRAADAPLLPLAILAIGLYGAAGIGLAVSLGWFTATIRNALPHRWIDDPERDRQLAGLLLAGAAGIAVLSLGAALGYSILIGSMHSRVLAAMASAGVALAASIPAVVVTLACHRPAIALAARLPRPRRTGSFGFGLLLLASAGMLAGLAALSRADWRVLDLGPLGALAAALLLGAGHGLFWYGTAAGARIGQRLPRNAIRALTIAGVLALNPVGARIPEHSPAFRALAEHSLGLRFGLRVARALTDHDGDGYSARFGGGDCDDHNAEVHPGADDLPSDGIDQNCEGGDARPQPAAAIAAPDTKIDDHAAWPRGNAFAGNILIISIDALRADRLGVADYGRPAGTSLTPNLDALARRGAYFRRAWAQAPNTPRSFPSFVTSRFPSEIAWQQKTANYSPILPSNQTFFEHLARVGLRPVGIFSHFYFTAERGLGKAFAEWSNNGAGTIAESNKDTASPRIVPRVIARLEKAAAAKERFVLWTHLFEPHSSYMEHAEFPPSLHGVAGLQERYDFEIAFVDRWVGKVMDALTRTGLAETTAVVVLADHGEAWGEHKLYFHGQDLSEEQLRVPLIVTIPGKPAVQVEENVALVDVGPTLLDLVGAAKPASFRGRSLLPFIDPAPGSAAPGSRPVFAELLPATAWPKHQVMMVDGKYKITHAISERRWELHDLATDPRQQLDLARDPAAQATLDVLRAKLLGFEEGRR